MQRFEKTNGDRNIDLNPRLLKKRERVASFAGTGFRMRSTHEKSSPSDWGADCSICKRLVGGCPAQGFEER